MNDCITPQDIPLKQCSKCKEWKPATAEYFHRNAQNADGLRPRCKPCQAEYVRNHRLANYERIAARDHAYYEANKERHKATMQRRYETKKEQLVEYRRAYYVANKERLKEYRRMFWQANQERLRESRQRWWSKNKGYSAKHMRKWRAKNAERARATVERRRAAKLNSEGNYSAHDVTRQYEAQKGRCYYCHTKVGDTYHVDHVIPLSRGGSNSPENIVIACPSCNRSKGARLPHEWPQGNRLI